MRKIAVITLFVLAMFAPREVCAQGQGVAVAELTVVRSGVDAFRFSVQIRPTPNDPGVPLSFVGPIVVVVPPFDGSHCIAGIVGAVQLDGSLLVDRSDLLDLFDMVRMQLGSVALLPTACGLLQPMPVVWWLGYLDPLGINESVTLTLNVPQC